MRLESAFDAMSAANEEAEDDAEGGSDEGRSAGSSPPPQGDDKGIDSRIEDEAICKISTTADSAHYVLHAHNSNWSATEEYGLVAACASPLASLSSSPGALDSAQGDETVSDSPSINDPPTSKPTRLSESLCCISPSPPLSPTSSFMDRAERKAFDFDEVVDVVGSATSSDSIVPRFGDDVIFPDDLSPLQHPNPYPIPHPESPESSEFLPRPPEEIAEDTFGAALCGRVDESSEDDAMPPLARTPSVTPDSSPRPSFTTPTNQQTPSRNHDYILKFLLVGDSDVGKDEILNCLSEEVSETPYALLCNYKTTTILIDGKRVKLQLWDTSGQGRFCTILRSYSRGAQGILLVYDITNKWSFDGIDRWLKEVDEHAPGVPKILVGNRLHLAYKRRVCETLAENYARKNDMAFFEVSPLCDFNIVESFAELSRVALQRNGMARLLKSDAVLSLQEIAIKAIVARTTVYSIDQLPLPGTLKQTLKSYSIDNRCNQNMRRYLAGPYAEKLTKKSPKPLNPSVASPHRGLARINSCCIS